MIIKTFDKFCELYNRGIPVKNLIKELGVSQKKYWEFYHLAVEKGYITPRINRSKKPKFYKKHGNGFMVQKSVNGTVRHFGTYHTEEMAELAVQILQSLDWNENYKWNVKAQVLEEFNYTER